MKRTLILIALCVPILATARPGWAQPSPFSGIVESVEARVNDEVITTSEVDDVLRRIEVELGRPFRSQAEYEQNRRRALDKLIEESLLVQEAKKRGFQMEQKQKEADVKREWERRVREQGGPEAMKQILDAAGMSEDDLKAQIATEVERNYLRDRVLRAAVLSKVKVSGEDIEQFKRENPTQLDALERVAVSHILIAVPENASPQEDAAARQKAERLVTQIRAAGPDEFEKQVLQNSDHEATRGRGGNLGYIRRGQMAKEFDVAFDMQPGDISDPIRTSQGYHILKVTDKRTIAELLRQRDLKKTADEFLNQLKEEAVIVVKGSKPRE